MSNNPIYDCGKSHRKQTFLRLYSVIFVILVIALGSIIFTLVRTDVVTNSVLKGQNIPFLLIISDDEGPILSEAVLFHAGTKRLALVDVPREAGDLLPSLQRSDRFSAFYQQGDLQSYQNSIARLLNLSFLFTLDLHTEQQVQLVDLLQGMRLYFFAPIDRIDPLNLQRYIYPAGEQVLDGDQSRDLLYLDANTLNYQDYLAQQGPNSSLRERSPERAAGTAAVDNSLLRQRNMRFARELLLSMVATLQQYPQQRTSYIGRMYRYFRTDLSHSAFRSLLLHLADIELQSAEVILQDYLGVGRMVQNKRINFPVYNGQVIRSQVARISAQLQSREEIAGQQYAVRVELLNGTNTFRLAAKTAAIFDQQGFEVVNIDNADRSDYEQTVVINLHSNNTEDVRRVAEVIGAENIVLHPLPGGEQIQAEVRVILGRDFDERITK